MKKNKEELFELNELEKRILDLLSKEKTKIELPQLQIKNGHKLVEQAVLVLSDIHYGKLNYFYDYQKERRICTYSPEIFIQESNRLLDAVQTINKLLFGGYTFERLNLFCVGDLVENEIIFKGQEKFISQGIVLQVVEFVSYFKKIILELLKLFPKIRVIVVGGNHGRIADLDGGTDWDYNNYDYLVGKIIQTIFEKQKRIEVVVPNSWFYVEEIYGWRYLLHHGSSVYSWMGIPYYGITRQSKSRRMEIPFDVEVIGHFHHLMEVTTSSQAKTLVNGCWIDKDQYGWKKFGNLSVPEQWYFGISRKRPISWQFKIDLRINR